MEVSTIQRFSFSKNRSAESRSVRYIEVFTMGGSTVFYEIDCIFSGGRIKTTSGHRPPSRYNIVGIFPPFFSQVFLS